MSGSWQIRCVRGRAKGMIGGSTKLPPGALLARKGDASPLGFGEVRLISLVGPYLAIRSLMRRANVTGRQPIAIAAVALALSWMFILLLTPGPRVEDSAAIASAPASPSTGPAEFGVSVRAITWSPDAGAGIRPGNLSKSSLPSRKPPQSLAPLASRAPTADAATGKGPAESAAGTLGRAAHPPAGSAPAAPLTEGRKAGYRVQLFALRSEASARQAWTRLQSKYGQIFGGLQPTVVRVRLGVSGAWIYRLQAGEFADRKAARKLCRRVRNRKLDCIVVRS